MKTILLFVSVLAGMPLASASQQGPEFVQAEEIKCKTYYPQFAKRTAVFRCEGYNDPKKNCDNLFEVYNHGHKGLTMCLSCTSSQYHNGCTVWGQTYHIRDGVKLN